MNKDVSKMILEKIMQVGEDVSSIKTTINQHTEDISDIKADVTIIKSDNQGNYLRFIEDKEKLHSRILPLEKDLEERQACSEENRKGFKQIFFNAVQWIVITGMAILLGYHEIKTK